MIIRHSVESYWKHEYAWEIFCNSKIVMYKDQHYTIKAYNNHYINYHNTIITHDCQCLCRTSLECLEVHGETGKSESNTKKMIQLFEWFSQVENIWIWKQSHHDGNEETN